MKEYAIYKGDKFLFIGNIDECSKFLNIKKSTVRWYTNPSAKLRDKTGNRINIERVEEDDY